MSVNFKKDFHFPMLLFHVIKNFNFIREKFLLLLFEIQDSYARLPLDFAAPVLSQLLFINPLMSISFCFTGGSHVESVWESRYQKAQNAANCHQSFAQVCLIFYSYQPEKHSGMVFSGCFLDGPSLYIGWRLL